MVNDRKYSKLRVPFNLRHIQNNHSVQMYKHELFPYLKKKKKLTDWWLTDILTAN